MKILVISDTHIPIAAKALPPQIIAEAKTVDLILHAGDFAEVDVLKELKEIKPVIAVAGNMDSYEIKKLLKQKQVVEIEGVKIGLMHGRGAPSGLLEVIRSEFKDVQGLSCVIYGHSHIPSIEIIDGVTYFNPGSSTEKVFAPYNSYGILKIENKKITPQIIKI